jgi:hypothetical protein
VALPAEDGRRRPALTRFTPIGRRIEMARQTIPKRPSISRGCAANRV